MRMDITTSFIILKAISVSSVYLHCRQVPGPDLKAQETGKPVQFCCAIGDETVGGIPYEKIVETARANIKSVGGFEAFAEWGLV